jgi:integrase
MAWITGKRGSYRVQWREGGRGSQVFCSTTFAEKADAETELRAAQERQEAARRSSKPPRAAEPLEDLLTRYSASRVARGSARAPWIAESEGYITAMAKAMSWTRVAQVTYGDLDRWRALRPDGVGTDKPLSAMKSFLVWCQEVGVPVDPQALRLKARRRKPRASAPLLTDQQLAMVLHRAAKFGPQYVALFEHMALYGCRPIDLCRLEVRDWDGAAHQVAYRDTKNGLDVTHPVHAAHAARLDALVQGRAPGDHIFQHRGQAWEVDELGRANQLVSWYKNNITRPERLREKEGVMVGIFALSQLGIYCLKDVAMTRLARAAAGDRRAVVAISGHKTLSVVDRYLQTNQQRQSTLIGDVTIPAAWEPGKNAG